ncbi:hypothetical protein PR202_ga20665 [Eleusine coracana subsp. coracana]|uniref:non-specific serine/threonine protein kinase n=1 Tax=Eleusine coracana subsp. coracana TaxID=191504 RepID=A0AAV5CYU9_ELECO|nr:hypothetical protein PR202_ga20665 [Eleusine coracana subsp. coracana]
MAAYGRARSLSPPKRRRSTDGAAQLDASSPKRPKHAAVAAPAMDVDADSSYRNKDCRNNMTSRVVRDQHSDRYDIRESYWHREGSDSRRSLDRWGSERQRPDYERWRDSRSYDRSSSSRDRGLDSKYNTSGGYKEMLESCEEVRDVTGQKFGEMKDKSFKKEGKLEHHEKVLLLSIYEGGPPKVEKARKISIVMKCQQHEKEQPQEVKSVPSINNTEQVTSMDGGKGISSVANVQAGNQHDSLDVSVNKADITVGNKPPYGSDLIISTTSGPVNKSERSTATRVTVTEPPAITRKTGKDGASHIQRNDHHDNWDDAEGYYSYRCGELLNGRYAIQSGHGKGVFSTVVRAKDLQAGKDDPEQVAIKIIRNNDTMNRAGKDEVSILRKLAGANSKDKHNCVMFISNFRYHNHLCLVFESLDMNLRQALKRHTGNTGFHLTLVRASSKQLFIALKHLKNCKILHCDIKPDNILLDDTKKLLKLCDFGSAMFAGMNEVTPYLVSRWYRAPEIILGLPYDHPLDMWSVGCCLYELYTGETLFPGPSNNDMLRRHMELKGPFPKKMLRKGAFTAQHFNRDMNFEATEDDPVTRKVSRRLILNTKPKGIGSKVSNLHGEDPKLLSSFKDLLDKIFLLDPEKRITVEQALSHPFITGKVK